MWWNLAPGRFARCSRNLCGSIAPPAATISLDLSTVVVTGVARPRHLGKQRSDGNEVRRKQSPASGKRPGSGEGSDFPPSPLSRVAG
jgi:hypothetical protein